MSQFCFRIVAVAGLASVVWGAGPDPAPRHVTSVVRSDPHTGKLVRTVVVTPKVVAERAVPATVVAARPAGEPASEAAVSADTGIDQLVQNAAAQHNLPAGLIHSVMKVESNFNPYAISPKGALGLMQLIPETARRFGVSNVFNPADNIQGGTKYLKYLMDLYDGDYALALAAYNAGEAAVAKYGGIPPYAETRSYVQQVYREFQKSVATQPKPASKQQPTAQQPVAEVPHGPAHIQEVIAPDGSVRYVSR